MIPSRKYVIRKKNRFYIHPTRDVNWYPEYLITIDPTLSTANSTVSSLFSGLSLDDL